MTNINKIISSVMLATSFAIMAILPSHPASLLFIFVSGNKWVSVSRLAVTLMMIALSFGVIRPRPANQRPLMIGGLSLILFGFIALLITSLGSFLYDYMKLLDVMIVIQAGIILCSLSLSLPALRPAKIAAKQTKAASKLRWLTPKLTFRATSAHSVRRGLSNWPGRFYGPSA